MAIRLADLTERQQESLQRYRTLPEPLFISDAQAVAELLEMGLLEKRVGGLGLSRAGRKLFSPLPARKRQPTPGRPAKRK